MSTSGIAEQGYTVIEDAIEPDLIDELVEMLERRERELAVARTFDDRLAKLCGYSIYSGLMGHIDKQDPINLLRGTSAGGMIWDQL